MTADRQRRIGEALCVCRGRFVVAAGRQQEVRVVGLTFVMRRRLVHHQVAAASLDGSLERLDVFDKQHDRIGRVVRVHGDATRGQAASERLGDARQLTVVVAWGAVRLGHRSLRMFGEIRDPVTEVPDRCTASVVRPQEAHRALSVGPARRILFDMTPISRGFKGRRPAAEAATRLPPGQYETRDFPVLSAGPTPHVPLDSWRLTLLGADGSSAQWSWDELLALPRERITKDIHCVTKWSKFDTQWEGVSIDTLLDAARAHGVVPAPYVMARAYGGYTTNLPLADLTEGKGWIAFGYDGAPLDPEHGGPARLLVPHLYFWKSAKWITELRLMERDDAGFWEVNGYHMRGDPWREQRYTGDP